MLDPTHWEGGLMQGHPVFERFRVQRPNVADRIRTDFLGVRTRIEFEADMPYAPSLCEPAAADPVLPRDAYPGFDEEYFEWIDVLETVCEARDRFTMIELGAGYGRWLVRAVAALRVVNPLPFRLVAVEPEPTHFGWLHEHLRENDIDPSDHVLVEAAVTAHGRPVPFHVGNAAGWYGQAIADPSALHSAPVRALRRLMARWRHSDAAATSVVRVPSVTLQDLLADLDRVDLVDLDVQGAEADVLGAAIDALDRKVRRVHVGTHAAEIEEALRVLFRGRGWQAIHDFPCLKASATPYGEIGFNDGVQTWLNPALAAG